MPDDDIGSSYANVDEDWFAKSGDANFRFSPMYEPQKKPASVEEALAECEALAKSILRITARFTGKQP